ncbi:MULTISPECIES: D-alanyl-D-alanine carboxypeptidase/D-alanyl-D-alanine-endopeptidase [Ramlibacter]|uniref:D-alanyl-D-alanine carboxypeptidase/D-alanyl-D-alanine-endopeptidase n=1 Tax=Ramlibacter pinisoli TaxID=2682844 RepID=A0A6N8J3T5_9BURK|nr:MULTISPECIES: D-alanyl-D-alanine carboxypeptidase/D-alanyl-D-alanine-endopeptidase [Ramlibacter]MBA2962980.1 D-alanyl-D-alanine carboxypeptidase/D-alanyl-D-alanine-endopeptidase [Ramlibacter sp. CGMCC 1.13660]MVQ32923.1 D-alanyl-D-alanine carboxypeptidase/D-alanyl-D-alanine-endopeptidase [Ramlibacter pinisoli]
MRVLPLLAVLLAATAAWAQPLPPEVDAALAQARLPRDAVTLLVTDVDPAQPPRLSHRAEVPVNPASIAKLATTMAALELLGPAYTWTTPVLTDGPIAGGTLQGNLYLQGSGDPKLVLERLWLLLRRVRALGIDRVAGDIVLDHGAFAPVSTDPSSFDGEPLRPYNATPDGLLLNFKSVLLTLVPQTDGRARLLVEPPLAGVRWPSTVPLVLGECGDWRSTLKADFTDPLRPRLAGSYPAACGERGWPLAFADPASYATRAVAGLWAEVGGRVGGVVRDGRVPATATQLAVSVSPPLSEVVRDINKYSNNVMAQQLFLTLGLQGQGPATREGARETLRAWWRDRIGPDLPAFDNGSGLSRDERITAQQLARLLQYTWASPLMPELAASLPAVGTDGTLRRTRTPVGAHLKSGSLRDVQGVAGYVDGAGGRRYVVVAIANHPNAAGFRPAVEALLAWAGRER